jgi:hypothetical protein
MECSLFRMLTCNISLICFLDVSKRFSILALLTLKIIEHYFSCCLQNNTLGLLLGAIAEGEEKQSQFLKICEKIRNMISYTFTNNFFAIRLAQIRVVGPVYNHLSFSKLVFSVMVSRIWFL